MVGGHLPVHPSPLSQHLPSFSSIFLSSSVIGANVPASPIPPHPTWCTPTPPPPLQAQRNNEDVSIIPPLFTVSVDHRVSGRKRLAGAQGKWGTQQVSALFGGTLCLCAPGGQLWLAGPPRPFLPSWLWFPFLQGTWNGPWVSTEVLAAVIGLVTYYLAFSAKSHIQA